MRRMIEEQYLNLETEAQKGKLVIAETKKQGLPRASSFFRYIVRFGRVNFLTYLYSSILWIALNIFFQLWCGIWVEDGMPGTPYHSWATGQICSILIMGYITAIAYSRGIQQSGIKVYRSLVRSILRRPMQFFDSTSVGTIINRTVLDRENIDYRLGVHGQFVYFTIL